MDQELIDSYRSALPGEPELEAREDSDGLYIDAAWPDGSEMKIQVTPGRVHYGTLKARGKKLYGAMCHKDCLPRFFGDRGVTRFTMSPTDDGSRGALLKHGAWEPNTDPPDNKPHGDLIWWLESED